MLLTAGMAVIVSEGQRDSELGNKIKAVFFRNESLRVVYISVTFILAMVLMFLIILFVLQYAVKTRVIVSQVFNFYELGELKALRIHPKTMCPRPDDTPW